MSTYPRYVPHTTGDGKWDNHDINAVVDHVQAGITLSGFLAYPFTYVVRFVGGKYQAIDSIGTLTFGSASDEGGVDGDDAAAVINAAMTAAGNNGGGSVFVRRGTADITLLSAIIPADRVKLIGEGTCFKADDALTGTMIDLTGAYAFGMRFYMCDFRLEGLNKCDIGLEIINTTPMLTFERIEVYGFKVKSIAIDDGTATTFSITFRDCTIGGYGIGAYLNNAHLITFDNCYFQSSDGWTKALHLYGCSQIQVTRCHFTGGSEAGMRIEGFTSAGGTPNDIVIDQCWFEQGAAGVARGIVMTSATAANSPVLIRVHKCFFTVWVYGIEVDYGNGVVIDDCHFGTLTSYDIALHSNAVNTTIMGGFYDAAGTGIGDGGVNTMYRGAGWEAEGEVTTAVGTGIATAATGLVLAGMRAVVSLGPENLGWTSYKWAFSVNNIVITTETVGAFSFTWHVNIKSATIALP